MIRFEISNISKIGGEKILQPNTFSDFYRPKICYFSPNASNLSQFRVESFDKIVFLLTSKVSSV